jgi:hypothetical protein
MAARHGDSKVSQNHNYAYLDQNFADFDALKANTLLTGSRTSCLETDCKAS